LQQLLNDLQANTAAQYDWITPNQFNDMHTTLSGGYIPLGGGATLTGDDARIRQGDDFLKQIVPIIMASSAYQNNGAIILWWDESEGDGVLLVELVESVPSDQAPRYEATALQTRAARPSTWEKRRSTPPWGRCPSASSSRPTPCRTP
jgi:hypothetical protein